MAENKLMTVVVPVYKVEQYINKCLDSLILPQEWMSRLEVLVVNDGTPDRSAEMAKEYEKRYPRVFRVIDKENGGHGSAWNRGLAEATGKYLRFLDSDDWFTTSEFVKHLEALEGLDVDLAISNYRRYWAREDQFQLMPVTGLTPGVVFDAAAFDWGVMPWDVANFWRCSYRTQMLRKEQPLFLEKVYYDDIKIRLVALILAKTAVFLDQTVYNYLLGRSGQTMAPEIQRERYLDKYAVLKDYFDFYLSHPVRDDGKNAYLNKKINYYLHNTFHQFSRFPYKESKKYLAEWKEYYRKLAGRIGLENYPYKSFKCYFSWPFPLYYYGRLLKDAITGGEMGLHYEDWRPT